MQLLTTAPRPQIWDLGGQANLRPSWATYYQHTDCIIMVRARRRPASAGRSAKVTDAHGHLLGTRHVAEQLPLPLQPLHSLSLRRAPVSQAVASPTSA
jgi:hypothetical protein